MSPYTKALSSLCFVGAVELTIGPFGLVVDKGKPRWSVVTFW